MKELLHFSIDLETMGVKYNAPIMSIGCVRFDITTGTIHEKFYINTSTSKYQEHFPIDMNTVKWWLQQDEGPRMDIASPREDAVGLFMGLNLLSDFIIKTTNQSNKRDAAVWGNGATFDIGILEYAYWKDAELTGAEFNSLCPWKFWNIRDMRTIIDVANDIGFNKSKITREGKHHNAVDDAVYQAKLIAAAYSNLTHY